MSEMPQPVHLVFDHVEALQNDDCLDTIAELALHLPTGSRLALGTRAEPPLPMARLRAGADVVEVGVDELAMTGLEGHALLDAVGVKLNDAEMDQLLDRTEGWPVGLYLAALALKAGGSREQAGVPFRRRRLVADYLRTELLARLSEAEVSFLTRTSVLDRVSGRLCDAVLDTTGSHVVLESLAHSNLLLVALDRHGEWYRYHHLFRDLLRAELQRREPELVNALHVRAAEWCEANRMPELAIDHAQGGFDVERVNRLVLLNAQKAFAGGRRETIRRWLGWFDDEDLVEQYPAVAVLGALFYVNTGDPTAAERWGIAAEPPSPAPLLEEARSPNADRPSGFFPTAARWQVGAPFFGATTVRTASTLCDATRRPRSTGWAPQAPGDAAHSCCKGMPSSSAVTRSEPTRSSPTRLTSVWAPASGRASGRARRTRLLRHWSR